MKALNIIFVIFIVHLLQFQTCDHKSDWFYPLKTNDLSSFTQVNGTAKYAIDKGILIGTSSMNSPNSFLALIDSYGDFILEFKVKIDMELNSGVQIRSICQSDLLEGRVHGYQVEIETSDRKWAGGIYDESRRGWLYPLTDNKLGQNAWKNEQWNSYRIEAIGKTIKTWVNGVPCAHLIDDKTLEGIIAFQVHSISDNRLEGKRVYWKDIRILKTNLEKNRIKVDGHIHQVDLTVM